MILPQDTPKKDKNDEEEGVNNGEKEEEEEEEPTSHLNLIWDEREVHNIDDNVLEEACVGNNYNLQSKGEPKYNEKDYSCHDIHQNISRKR